MFDHTPRRLVLLAIILLGLSTQTLAATPVTGLPVPDRMYTLADGQSARISDLRGQGVVILFWATWCPFCARLMPGLEHIYEARKSDGLTILAVSIKADEDPVSHFRRLGYTYSLVPDGDAWADEWGVSGTPTMVFVDRAGKVIATSHLSDPNSEELKRLIDRTLQPEAN
jgi:thiol-disulfide isomerase/thioredoxin